jgi:hypothetical protein
MFFPKVTVVLLCAAALSEAFSIPDVGYLGIRSPQNFGSGGGSRGFANGNNKNAAKGFNSGGGNAKASTTEAAAAAASTKAATGNNNAAAAGTACLKSNAVQTGSADDGNATPADGQSASAT